MPDQKRQQPAVRKAATGWAIFLVASSGAALAQDQSAGAAEDIGEVVVTGIRKSIQDSINVKKNDSSIVEVVSAEDIGKLPDSSIADSISRLPGIAAQRTNGRAQTLSIRGLGPDFTVTTLNGREQATTNDNRTVEFDQYPSELVTQVKIYKTPDAGMAYQGIAGTTDIGTVHPLAFSDRRTAVTYRREQNAQQVNIPGLERTGNRANLTYIDQFRDHTVGVAFGFAYNKSPYQAQTREPWGYRDADGNGPGTDQVISGDKDGVQSSNYGRKGYLGVLEFAPNDSLHMLVDAYHSDFTELQTIQRIEYSLDCCGATTVTLGPAVNGRVTSGSFTTPFVVIENYNNDRKAEINSVGWNTQYTVNDNWDLTGDLSWSSSKRTDLRVESTAGKGTPNAPGTHPQVPDTVSFTTDANGITHLAPAGDYSDYDSVFLLDPGGWGGGSRRSGFVGRPTVDDDIKAIRLAANRKLEGFLSDLSFGVNYADREKSKVQWQSVLHLPGGQSFAQVPEEFRTGIANTAFFGSSTGMIGYNAIAMYNSGFWEPVNALDDPTAGLGDRQSVVNNTWTVNEKLTTAYVKVGIDTELGSLPLRGNVGVQSITADQSANLGVASQVLVPGTTDLNYTRINDGTKYTETLPSLNLALEMPHDMKLRMGAAVTVARPRMDQLGGGAGITPVADSEQPATFPGEPPMYWKQNNGGNPHLKPWKANTFDLSLEKYFGDNKGYVSVAGYYKKLTRYIVPQSTIVSFDGEVYDQTIAGQTNPANYSLANANRLGVVTEQVNGSGGWIKGVEVTASVPFSLFSDALDGFGFIISGARNSSELTLNGTPSPVPGLSTKILNSTLYYEKSGFSARVSNRYRGEFVGEVPDFDSSLITRLVESESLLDAQVGYEFKEGTLKGLSVSLTGTNLTDEPFHLFNVGDEPDNIVKYQNYGATYSLALTYSF